MNEDQEVFPDTLEEQLAYFNRLAVSRPSKDDPMGMVQLGATLVASRLATLLLEAKLESKKEPQS